MFLSETAHFHTISNSNFKRFKPQTKKATQNKLQAKPAKRGGYPIFTSKSQGKDGSATEGGGLVFVTKNHHKNEWVPCSRVVHGNSRGVEKEHPKMAFLHCDMRV